MTTLYGKGSREEKEGSTSEGSEPVFHDFDYRMLRIILNVTVYLGPGLKRALQKRYQGVVRYQFSDVRAITAVEGYTLCTHHEAVGHTKPATS